MIDVIATVLMAWVVIAVFFMLRNVWLFNRLMKLSSDEALSIRHTYGKMILMFWVWDVRKFL